MIHRRTSIVHSCKCYRLTLRYLIELQCICQCLPFWGEDEDCTIYHITLETLTTTKWRQASKHGARLVGGDSDSHL